MSDKLEQLIMGLAADMKNKSRANNFKFRNEEDALYHASRVAQLKSGSYITFRDTTGMRNAVVMGVEENTGRIAVAVWNPEDGEIDGINIPPSCVIFDNMPAERTDAPLALEAAARENAAACESCEDDEWDGTGPASEFPRT